MSSRKACSLWLVCAILASASSSADVSLPPSPYEILGTRHLATPVVDAVDVCVPRQIPAQLEPLRARIVAGDFEQVAAALEQSLDGNESGPVRLFSAILAARRARDRAQRLSARTLLRGALRGLGEPEWAVCGRLELARLDLFLDRLPEAVAQTRLAERELSAGPDDDARREAAAFHRAEALYRNAHPFEAHLGFRELAHSRTPRIAAGARLRLTDLSFDAGKSESVKIEYEALLPRAEAYGASVTAWALRAAEAALDAGDARAADAWLQRYLDAVSERELRDPVEIRRADALVLLGRQRDARNALLAIKGRKELHDVGRLAAVRLIDLRLTPDSSARQFEALLRAVAARSHGLRVYSLGVLVHALSETGRLDDALAAATRLAFEGDSVLLTPRYRSDLDTILRQSVAIEGDEAGCVTIARRLGGRFSILIERTQEGAPFLKLGRCLERLDMSWMAVSVYQRLLRSYGSSWAREVALPLARASLASGDVPLARAASRAGVESDPERRDAWLRLLAEAELEEDRADEATGLLRPFIARPGHPLTQSDVHSALLFARAAMIGHTASTEDRSSLHALLTRVPEALSAQRSLDYGEACLWAAEIERRAGARARARELYDRAAKSLPEGGMQAESLFWRARLARDSSGAGASEEERGLWQSVATLRAGGAWSRLARFELAFGPLQARFGEHARR